MARDLNGLDVRLRERGDKSTRDELKEDRCVESSSLNETC